MTALILFGFALGLDSFRASLALGCLRPSASRQRRIALAFGLCDGVAPLVGLWLGHGLAAGVGDYAGLVGPLVLGGYGLYAIRLSRREGDDDGPSAGESRWLVWGLPLSLSFDNFAAGVGLGVLAFPALLSAVVIGATSGLMAWAGLWLGRTVGARLPLRAELLGGVLVLLLAVALALDLL